MSAPIKTLPVVQNWDCQATGSCCKEYRVNISPEEKQRLDEQGWSPADLDGYAPYTTSGLPWARKYYLEHRPDGSCVFLSPTGRCRIHEKFGYDTKPLPCRLFPFVLIPVADHWRVGLRFACPSAAASKGRALPDHNEALLRFASELAQREKVEPRDGNLVAPPPLERGQKLDWPDILRVVDALLSMLRNRRDPFERRMRKCLHVVGVLRDVRFDQVNGPQLSELLDLLKSGADAEVPANLMTLPPPGGVGRMLFRLAAAIFARKDHGPRRGLAAQGRRALFGAAWRFARGKGPVPRMHAGLPESTFEDLEVPRGPLPLAAEEVLERYYTIKVGSLQFCGPPSFGMPVWEGFEALAVTLPVILWVARMYRDVPREQAVMTALTAVDDHVGFNHVLGTFRQRLSFYILARTGELSRLIGWYSR